MYGEDHGPPSLGSRLSRRRFVTRAAAVGAGAVGATRLDRPAAPARAAARFGAHVRQAAALVVGFTLDDARKIQPLIDEYSRANNVQITVRSSRYDEFYADVNANLTGVTGLFDVVSLDDPWIPQFAAGDFLMNIGEMIARRGVDLGDFVPELLALGDFPAGSGLRAIPWVGNVQVFAWRTDVLAGLDLPVPKTWDEVLATARRINESGGSGGAYGFGLRGMAGNSATTSFLPVLRGHGIDIFAADKWEPQLTTPPATQAITTHLELAKLAPPGVENVDHEANGRNFYTGLTAMCADIWPDQILQIYDPELSRVVGKVEIGPEPAQSSVEPVTMTGNALLSIPQGSKDPGSALDFILWLTAPEQQKRLLLEHNVAATRTSVLQDPEAVAQRPFLPGLLDAARNAFPRPRTPLYPQVEIILGEYLALAIAGQMGGEEALALANEDIRALMIRNQQLEE